MIVRDSIYNPTNMETSPYYNEAKYVGKGGYYKGNNSYQCVNYGIGRTCELSKQPITYYNGISTKDQIAKPMFNRSGYGDACNWIRDTLWEVGDVAKVGAIMVYGKGWGGGLGHIRVVEKIEGNKIFYSASNENRQMAFKWIDMPKITNTGFLGYIYNPFINETSNLIKIEKDDAYDWKWSIDGNKYGDKYDITTENGFADTELEKQGYELVLKVNGSLFYTYENKHYACGLEKSRGINNQSCDMTCVSDYNTCMAIAGFEDDLYFGKQSWIINNILNQSYCAITGLGLILNGKKRDDMHKGFESQWNIKSGRTIIGEDIDGNFMSYSIKGDTGKSGLTCYEAQDLCLELGFYNCIALDGGGSVFRWVNGAYDITSTRKVKNALLLYRKKKEQPQESVNALQEKYDTLKVSYDNLLVANDELQEMLEKVVDEKANLTNQLTQAQKQNEELNSVLEKIGEILWTLKKSH